MGWERRADSGDFGGGQWGARAVELVTGYVREREPRPAHPSTWPFEQTLNMEHAEKLANFFFPPPEIKHLLIILFLIAINQKGPSMVALLSETEIILSGFIDTGRERHSRLWVSSQKPVVLWTVQPRLFPVFWALSNQMPAGCQTGETSKAGSVSWC